MSEVFSPGSIGSMKVANRFVHSATYECMAGEDGSVTDRLVKRYTTLARGEIGLIVPGYLYVHPWGRAQANQTGIDCDDRIPGLARLSRAVHEAGGKIAFQLAHAGRQTDHRLIGRAPLAPSGHGRDPVSMSKPRMMSEAEIEAVIEAFAQAARRAVEADADAIQLHAAHGYLISQFLSPFYNRRRDAWGRSIQGRFRLLAEIVRAVRAEIGRSVPLMVKMNTRDFTPRQGVVPDLAREYAKALVGLGVDAIELSCGTFYTFHTVRGEVPTREIAAGMPAWMRPVARIKLGLLQRPCAFEDLYNEKPSRLIRPVMDNVALILVGGIRTLTQANALIRDDVSDFVSMSRPFIREPNLVKKYRTGKVEQASCTSCNKCFAAVFNRLPLKCYAKGLPPK